MRCLICDTWEVADALNRRLHDTLSTAGAPSLTAARDQPISGGDIVMSRSNDVTIEVRPGPERPSRTPTASTRFATATAGG